MSWINPDGLFVKFGREEADVAPGGEFGDFDMGRHVIEFEIDYTDAQSTSSVILGSVAGEPRGVHVPTGFVAEFLEILPTVAFTSSGTIGTSTLVIGLVKESDRSTAYDVDEYTTTSFAASVLDATAEGPTRVDVGTTGAGDGYGVATTENTLIVVANSQHASHPFTAGTARCRLVGRYGL